MSRDDRETIRCKCCGYEMFASRRLAMYLHERECVGVDLPRERFESGDRVETSDFGIRHLLGECRRVGEIVGFSNDSRCVRVQWDGRKTPQKLMHLFVRST